MEENKEEMEQQFVEIMGEDGKSMKCDVYDIIDFEEKTYALLLPLSEDEANDDAELIVMEYVEEGEDEAYFQNIEDDAEFKRVCEYIENLDDTEDEE